MAAAAVGDGDLARGHADEALALAASWEIALVADWLLEQRRTYDF